MINHLEDDDCYTKDNHSEEDEYQEIMITLMLSIVNDYDPSEIIILMVMIPNEVD